MKIAVLAGGYSPERDVSLSSGSLIANALIGNGHRVLLLDVYLGLSSVPTKLDDLFQTTPYPVPRVTSTVPDLDRLKQTSGNGDALIGAHVLEVCRHADLVFLALHGAMGENGQLQATLDNYGIRYTGSGYIGSLLAMDKDIAKKLLAAAGVPTPKGICYRVGKDDPHAIADLSPLPAVVKPVSCGSSVGVFMVDTKEELTKALESAAVWDDRILVERRITGRELTVGILDGETLPLVEIIPDEGFYDYHNKYQGNTREVCPAQLPEAVARRASEWTRIGFDALHLSGYARFDYLLDQENQLWCLEANTLPGMTPTSLLPQAASAAGIDYPTLCERIVEGSLKKKG